MGDSPSSLPFSTVLAEELEAVRERRRRNHLTPDKACGDGRPSEPAESRPREDLEQLRQEALNEDLVALAFSGGGIRSATFNLGILQGLADLELLKQFDYLSTVSGGGYVGSWLSAWIKREGDAENVELQLQSSRVKQAAAKREGLKPGEVFDAEPEPIHHLRAYSNYLTPHLGFFSADTWGLFSIYLRNLLLNLLVLVPLFLGMIMSERLLIMVFNMTSDPRKSGTWENVVWIAGQMLAVLMLVLVFRWIHRSMQQIRGSYREKRQPASYRRERMYLHRHIMIPLLILGVLVTWLSHARFEGQTGPVDLIDRVIYPAVTRWLPLSHIWFARLLSGLSMAVVVGTFHLLVGLDRPQHLKDMHLSKSVMLQLARVGLGVLTGFVGGVLLYQVFTLLHSLSFDGKHGSVLALTLGPPLFLAALILIAFIQIGLISRLWSEAIREWWSSLTGTAMIYLFGWIMIAGLSIWGPWLILVLEQKLEGIGAVLGAGWVSAVASGMMAGRNISQGRTGRFGEYVIRVVPIVFLIGLIVLNSFITDYFVPVWGFAKTPEQYLHSVEQVGIPLASETGSPAGDAAPAAAKLRLLNAMCLTIAVLFALTVFASRRININTFSLNALYRNRLARCYLGASRPKAWASDGSHLNRGAPTNVTNCSPRSPNPITGFDPHDDFPLSELRFDSHQRAAGKREKIQQAIDIVKARQNDLGQIVWSARWLYRLQNWWELKCLKNRLAALHCENDYVGPIPILSTALNLVEGGELAWRERMAESFALTPFYCGSLTTGYAPTPSYAGGISVAQAVSISGAAVSPNMGYHSYRPVTALLTIFNLRLGAWLGNPRSSAWKSPGPKSLLNYMKNELLGLTNADQDFVYLSDGGHFDNLGLYELIRRRCRYIVACDSGADPDFTYADLASVIRKARVDFGIPIQIETQKITPDKASGFSGCHVAIGRIFYGDVDCPATKNPNSPSPAELESEPSSFRPECNEGLLIYLKPSLTGDEPQDVLNYRASNPLFPHQATTNQWFSESQFESYRALGWHIACTVFDPVVREFSPGEETERQDLFQNVFKQSAQINRGVPSSPSA